MGRGADLETLRKLFADERPELALGTIKKLGAASDRSVLRVAVEIFPDLREVIARMTWSSVGTDSGDFEFPAVGDLVLVCFVDRNPDDAFVISRLTSKEDTIPIMAMEGHRVVKAKKELFLNSPTKINITKENAGTEPLVLGLVLQTFATELIGKLKGFIGDLKAGPITLSTAPGAPTAPFPAFVTKLTTLEGDLDSLLEEFVTEAETNFLSQLAFTERGEE